jgi:DNA invertase Pin-like site-specific DNA recombinase
MAVLAEFIRELVVEGTLEGLDTARARGAARIIQRKNND